MAATAQPRQDRSIKSSSHVASKPLTLRPLVPEAREAVAKCVENLLGSDWRISHRLIVERDKKSLTTEPYCVWKREGRERPGLFILQGPDQPAVYWDMDRDQPDALRFQIPFGFLRGGTWIFSATLLRGERRLVLEDVFVADGVKLLGSAPYSDRYSRLSTAFTAFTSQQLFLGFTLVLVEPLSLKYIIDHPPEPGTIWDFQPEVSTRLRLYWICPGARIGLSAGAKARAAEATSHLKLPPEVNKNVLKRGTAIPTIRVAFAAPDRASPLPDNYVLTTSDNMLLGRASVSKLDQSIVLRNCLCKPESPAYVPVEIVWNTGFNKYEIMRVLPADTPAMAYSSFYEIHPIQEANI
jgi:hypothetical protein